MTSGAAEAYQWPPVGAEPRPFEPTPDYDDETWAAVEGFCLAKIQASLGLEPRTRYERLADFYRGHGLQGEADFARARAAELR